MKKQLILLTLVALASCARKPVTNPRSIDGRPGARATSVHQPPSADRAVR